MSRALNIDELRARARGRLPRFVFDYVDGAADDERTLARNTADLADLTLWPRALRDVSTIDLSVDVLGMRWPAPIGIAPVGFAGLVRPGGDSLLARAATSRGLPFVLSTASNERIEDVAAAADLAGRSAPRWMQLYVTQDRALAERTVRRAAAAGYGALVLTVDVPIGGNRERDVRNGFSLPLRPSVRMAMDILSRPHWALARLQAGAPTLANLVDDECDRSASPTNQVAILSRQLDRSLTWEAVTWLRRLWPGPLLIKGLLHADDARLALQAGADGIVVSNHGGRQLDGVPSTIAALPAVVDAVGARMPVFIDSGFRRGTDVAKALALGARAVFVGRPVLWGLAAAGEAGVGAVLDQLMVELERTLILSGTPSCAALDAACLGPGPARPTS